MGHMDTLLLMFLGVFRPYYIKAEQEESTDSESYLTTIPQTFDNFK